MIIILSQLISWFKIPSSWGAPPIVNNKSSKKETITTNSGMGRRIKPLFFMPTVRVSSSRGAAKKFVKPQKPLNISS